ncbi:hypothetical protein [Desertimonas flava]|uniref:AbiU2 domain-containing protein n=1 Tax=Desertimonas flava TaxID=2064846 RepID=UPI0013C4AAD9|nr:hypothetical protein [Desertimonas flava]
MRVEKWKRWLREIELDVIALHHDRVLWRTLDAALSRRDESEFFRRHYMRLYVASAAMCVRRLVFSGTDSKSISLVRLLRELADDPGHLTAARHRQLFEDVAMGPDYGEKRFEAEWGDGHGHLAVDRVESDLASLERLAEAVKLVADRTIAHLDRRGIGDERPTFAQLDAAIDEIGRIFVKYHELIDGSSIVHLEPVVQGDWKAPFRAAVFGADE